MSLFCSLKRVCPYNDLSVINEIPEVVYDGYRQFCAKRSSGVKTILIIEDDEAIGEFLVQAIQQETPHQAVLASDGFQALKMLHTLKPDLFLLDYHLPDMNGLQFYDTIHAVKALEHLPVLLISAEATRIQTEVKARQLPLLKKPIELIDLLESIERYFTWP